MADHKILNKVIATLVFLLAFIIFFTTMAPTVSFWDCGEYIASCYSLGIPHPPGNPFFILLGRVFTMMLNTDQVAFRVNIISVISGAFSALFLYLIVVRSVVGVLGDLDEPWKKTTAYVGGLVGAAFGVFNYTFWFSAIEASVYVPSLLTIIINVYIALVWAQSKDKNRDRFLLLFSYLSFLGVGIHMMALFSLIPIFIYVLFVDKEKRFDWRLWGVAFIMGSVAYDVSSFLVVAPLLFILLGIFAYVPRYISGILALVVTFVAYMYRIVLFVSAYEKFTAEIFTAELFSLFMMTIPYLIIMAIAAGDLIVEKSKEARQYSWKFCFYMVFFALIGYSVHAYIPIRSALEPMIDENHPVIRLDNAGKGQAGHDRFMDALANEAVVNEKYNEFIADVKKDKAAFERYSAFNGALKDLAIAGGKAPAAAFMAFESSVATDSAISALRTTFATELVNDGTVETAYNQFTGALLANADKQTIQAKYEQFKNSLKSSADIKNAYVAYIKAARKNSSTGTAYTNFIGSFVVESPAKLYNAFLKAVESESTLQSQYASFKAELSKNEMLQSKFNAFETAIKNDDHKSKNLYLAFQDAVDRETGVVEGAYYAFVDAVEKDAKAVKLMAAYEDDYRLGFVGTKSYKAFIEYAKSTDTLKDKYSAFETALANNGAVKKSYDSFVKSLNYRKLTGVKMDAFKGFLERKQYGSESMIVRSLHRRGALNTQFGFDGHMGLLGFHLTQFYHFGEDISVDRQASRADRAGAIENNNVLKTTGVLDFKGIKSEAPADAAEGWAYFNSKSNKPFYYTNGKWKQLGSKVKKYKFERATNIGSLDVKKLKKNTVVYDSQNKTFMEYTGKNWKRMGSPGLSNIFYVLIYLIPSFFVIFGIGYWAKSLDLNAAVLFFLLLLSTSIGFAVYMNFADGTRPDSARDVKRHNENYDRRFKNYEKEVKQWMEYTTQAAAYYKSQNQPVPEMPPRPEAPKKGKPGNVHREVRIRDYFYTAGFTFFGLWIGLSAVAFMHMCFVGKFAGFGKSAGWASAGIFGLTIVIPIWSNYDDHDRTEDWIPYDYAYNLLMSCKQDAILFTNGDNDTFPLWFLQEAEGIRKDVRVVNFSLLNTPWYIRQLRDLEPSVPIPYNDYQIEPSDDSPAGGHQSYGDFMSARENRDKLEVMNPNPYGYFPDAPDSVNLEIAGLTLAPPQIREQHYLTIANLLVHDIINHNNWKKPIYFTVNTPNVSLMGTGDYLEIQGMVQELKRTKVPFEDKVNLEVTQNLLDNVYKFRSLEGGRKVKVSETAEKTARNYAYVFLRYVDAKSGYGIIKNLQSHIREDQVNIGRYNDQLKRINDVILSLAGDTSPQAQKQLTEARSYYSRYSKELELMKLRLRSNEQRLPREIDMFREKLPEVLSYIDRAVDISPEINDGLNYKQQFLSIAGPNYDKNGYPIKKDEPKKVESKVEPKKETPKVETPKEDSVKDEAPKEDSAK